MACSDKRWHIEIEPYIEDKEGLKEYIQNKLKLKECEKSISKFEYENFIVNNDCCISNCMDSEHGYCYLFHLIPKKKYEEDQLKKNKEDEEEKEDKNLLYNKICESEKILKQEGRITNEVMDNVNEITAILKKYNEKNIQEKISNLVLGV